MSKTTKIGITQLAERQDEILDALIKDGLCEVSFRPYTYAVPVHTKFDGIGDSNTAVVAAIAEINHSTARTLKGEEANDYFYEHGGRWRLVEIFDPFAQTIDEKVRTYRAELVKSGKARVVNGRFFKVA